jgi:D-glycero-D-manno-heptose 1,7-bisphosphate phosphatase
VLVLVITNQSGIARGYYEEFHAFPPWIDGELARYGAHIDATYDCPHHPTEGRGEYRRVCRCRKPAPGLIERAHAEWRFDPTRSVLVGDATHDAEAAAGIRGVRFERGNLLQCVSHAFVEPRCWL